LPGQARGHPSCRATAPCDCNSVQSSSRCRPRAAFLALPSSRSLPRAVFLAQSSSRSLPRAVFLSIHERVIIDSPARGSPRPSDLARCRIPAAPIGISGGVRHGARFTVESDHALRIHADSEVLADRWPPRNTHEAKAPRGARAEIRERLGGCSFASLPGDFGPRPTWHSPIPVTARSAPCLAYAIRQMLAVAALIQ